MTRRYHIKKAKDITGEEIFKVMDVHENEELGIFYKIAEAGIYANTKEFLYSMEVMAAKEFKDS